MQPRRVEPVALDHRHARTEAMIWLRAADRSGGNSRLGSRRDIAVGRRRRHARCLSAGCASNRAQRPARRQGSPFGQGSDRRGAGDGAAVGVNLRASGRRRSGAAAPTVGEGTADGCVHRRRASGYRPAATAESDSLLDYALVTGPDGDEAGGQPAYQVSTGCRVVSRPWPTASC